MCVCETKDEFVRHSPAPADAGWQPRTYLRFVLRVENKMFLAYKTRNAVSGSCLVMASVVLVPWQWDGVILLW